MKTKFKIGQIVRHRLTKQELMILEVYPKSWYRRHTEYECIKGVEIYDKHYCYGFELEEMGTQSSHDTSPSDKIKELEEKELKEYFITLNNFNSKQLKVLNREREKARKELLEEVKKMIDDCFYNAKQYEDMREFYDRIKQQLEKLEKEK